MARYAGHAPIRLIGEDGAFVANAHVPARMEPPDVIVWGSRLFTPAWGDDNEIIADVYKEAFGFHVSYIDTEEAA